MLANLTMLAIDTKQRPLSSCVNESATTSILPSDEKVPRTSVSDILSKVIQNDSPRTPRTPQKTKDDIRYYFRPIPREDIRVYFRPINKMVIDRPRPPRSRAVPSPGKPKVRSRRVSPARAHGSPTGTPRSPQGPELPPKAKARSSGQKNREIFNAKQRLLNDGTRGITDQKGSAALPGFDPDWSSNSDIPPSSPLSPRITEVVDSSLMPSPLRNKSLRTSPITAESAPEYDERSDRQKHLPGQEYHPTQEYQQSLVQEYQQTTLPYKPNSIYGTLPPLPIRLQRNNSNPTPQSPKMVRHRRQDTPYSPNDVGRYPNPDVSPRTPSVSDLVGRSSTYASSDVLPTPSALEIWASERRRIAHGQPAAKITTNIAAHSVSVTGANTDKDKTLKKTRSIETRLFRSRKGRNEKNEKEKVKERVKEKESYSGPKKDSREAKFDPIGEHEAKIDFINALKLSHSESSKAQQNTDHARATRVVSQDLHHPGTRWDVGSLPPSPEIVRPAIEVTTSDMSNRPRSDSVSDKIVVDPPLVRAHSDESAMPLTPAGKAKKPNKFLRMLEAYSRNVEGLQMVQ